MANVEGAKCDWCQDEAEGLAIVEGILYVSCGRNHHPDQRYLRWRLKKRSTDE